MYYVVMDANRKFVKDASDCRFAALFTTREQAQRVADHTPGGQVIPHVEYDNPFAGVTCFADGAA
jgi:hypothetical protein